MCFYYLTINAGIRYYHQIIITQDSDSIYLILQFDEFNQWIGLMYSINKRNAEMDRNLLLVIIQEKNTTK